MRAQVSAQEKNGDSVEVSPGGVRGTELFQMRHWLADGTNNTAQAAQVRNTRGSSACFPVGPTRILPDTTDTSGTEIEMFFTE